MWRAGQRKEAGQQATRNKNKQRKHLVKRRPGGRRRSHKVVFKLVKVPANVLVRLLLFIDLQQRVATLRLFPRALRGQGALLLLPFPRRLGQGRNRREERGGPVPARGRNTEDAASQSSQHPPNAQPVSPLPCR